MTRDFMREGERLFEWEPLVIEKRRTIGAPQPTFDDPIQEALESLPEETPSGGGLVQRLLDRIGKSQS